MRSRWWTGALLALLCLAGSGCRPLLATPPGCEEDRDADCEPTLPESTAEVRLTAPAGLVEPTDGPPIFGRYLPVVLEVIRGQGTREVELLCGDRRLATWWISDAEEGALTLRALADLLSCRTPGTHAHPLPVTLSVIAEDALGARQDHGQFDLLADFTVEEGERLEPGDPSAPASASVELSDEPPTADGLPALLRVEGLLGQAPVVRVEGVRLEVWPVRDGWRFFLPPPDFSDAIDAMALDIDVQVELQTAFGVTSFIAERVTIERILRTLRLEGSLFSPGIPKPSALPVMTPDGLVMVLDDTSAPTPGTSARLVRIPADPSAPLQQLTFPLDAGGGPETCSNPDDQVSTTAPCILGLTGSGGLVLRHPQPTPQLFRMSVLAAEAWARWTPDAALADLLGPSIVDPAPYAQPLAWGRLGEDRFCAEARTTSCAGAPCEPFARACVLDNGAVETVAPAETVPSFWEPGESSRGRGSSSYFLTYAYTSSFSAILPVLTVGTQSGGQLAMDFAGNISWGYQRGLSTVVPVRDGFAIVSRDWHNAFYPGSDAQREQFYSGAWNDGRYPFFTTVHVEPDGSLIVLGEGSDAVQSLSRWSPGATQPQIVQALPMGPDGFDSPPQPSMDLVEDGYSRTFSDGSSALVYRTADSLQPYRLVVVDPQLRPLLRRRSSHPMRVEPGPDGESLWIIEAAPDGNGNQITIVSR